MWKIFNIVLFILVMASLVIEHNIIIKRQDSFEARLRIVEQNTNTVLNDDGRYKEYDDVDVRRLAEAKTKLANILEKRWGN